MHYYQSSVGTFIIKPAQDNRWTLLIDDEFLGSYGTANQAAGDVHDHATGCDDWDLLLTYEAPDNIQEWSKTHPSD